MGIDVEWLVKTVLIPNGMGGARQVVVPKNKKSAQAIVDQINKRVISGKARIADKVFTSISMCEKVNYFTHYSIQFEIQIPTGTRGLLTSNCEESEFITATGTILEILRAEAYNDGEKDCIRIFAKLLQEV